VMIYVQRVSPLHHKPASFKRQAIFLGTAKERSHDYQRAKCEFHEIGLSWGYDHI
jgi:hypothetical protein